MKVSIFVNLFFFLKVNSQSVPNVCFCVTAGYCNNNNNNNGGNNGNNQDGANQIDIRIQANSNLIPSSQTGSQFNLTYPASSGINYVVNNNQNCQNGLQSCCPSVGYQCGVVYPPIQGAKVPNTAAGETQYGSYPWMAVIVEVRNGEQYFVGTGALIDNQHVLTVAHKVYNKTNNFQTLGVLFGEWDAGSNSELISSQFFTVIRIFTHPQANYNNLKNDVAIIRLSSLVQLGQTPTITTACLPSSSIPMNIRCMVAGWGVNTFGSDSFSTIQKEVDIPLIDANQCQNLLRATRLGSNFILDSNSFICGGGENGKDACTGDGGSPLMCKILNQWYVFGLVAWGIGCGQANVPGVYVNVANYVNWIQQTTRQN
ncbi:hypothetical protein PVAND_017306 [Polypedilum vanderplanki]|uniref:Peptidase S1 domain-containing protein n=1 Tax=Polypedilum vanderplanki TaxID=319348 RepID=A0A9J6BIP1_POLVA|nr:hypothetical protein PVAND_017306 [Polypedilum vanderplanki]